MLVTRNARIMIWDIKERAWLKPVHFPCCIWVDKDKVTLESAHFKTQLPTQEWVHATQNECCEVLLPLKLWNPPEIKQKSILAYGCWFKNVDECKRMVETFHNLQMSDFEKEKEKKLTLPCYINHLDLVVTNQPISTQKGDKILRLRLQDASSSVVSFYPISKTSPLLWAYLHSVLLPELSKYRSHTHLGVDKIVLVKCLKLNDESWSSIPDFFSSTLFVDIECGAFDPPYQAALLHHELFHFIEHSCLVFFPDIFKVLESKWNAIQQEEPLKSNRVDWESCEISPNLKKKLFSHNPDTNYVTDYAATSAAEDRAETFSYLLMYRQLSAMLSQPIRQKCELLNELLASVWNWNLSDYI